MKIAMALVALSVIPLVGGLTRLLGLAGFADVEGHARFAADPIPAVLHIVSATLFATLGALQFAPTLRRRSWHRFAGRVLAPLGILAGLAGIYMVLSWPPKPFDSLLLNALRLAAGGAMVAFIVRSLIAVYRRDLGAHGRFMTRAYALGAAGGTQAFTLLPFAASAAFRTELSMALLMGAGWLINLAVAEWALRRTHHRVSPPGAQGALPPAALDPASPSSQAC
jgi:uncharacterized membrane protein